MGFNSGFKGLKRVHELVWQKFKKNAFTDLCQYTAVSKPGTLRATYYPFLLEVNNRKYDAFLLDIIGKVSVHLKQ